MDKERVAVFVDTENITGWLKAGGLDKLLQELAGTGQVVVRRAYGKWTHPSLASHQAQLNRLGFELVHTFHPVSGKNSSDIRMTVDVMDFLWRAEDIQWLVLATGDSDFSPLFQKAREMGKGVIGVGPRSALSEAVKSSCSRFIYTDQMQEKHGQLAAAIQHEALDDAFDVLEKALNTYDGPANIASLKLRMLELDSAFDEKIIGFRNFLDFLKASEDVILSKDESTWYASLPSGEIEAPQALDDTLPEPVDPTESYRRALRKKNWRSISGEALFKIYEAIVSTEALPRSEIQEQVIEKIGAETTLTEIRKALALLLKSGYLNYEGENEEGDSLWRVVPGATREKLFKAVDIAMAVRLLSGCTEQAISLEADNLADLVLGETSPEYLSEILKLAQDRQRGETDN